MDIILLVYIYVYMCCRLTAIPTTYGNNKMSGWDDDEEENVEKVGGGGRLGRPYYGIIASYKNAHYRHIMPHHYKLNNKGERIESSYNKAQYVTEEGTWKSVQTERVVKWSTKKDTLDKMSSEQRQACNAIKAFLMKEAVLLYFHNGACDECALFKEPHWHIVVKSQIGANGHFKYLHDLHHLKTMRAKCDNAGGYVKVQSIRIIECMVRYCNTPPRKFMGCSYKALFDIYNEAKSAGPIAPDQNVADFFDPPEEDEEEEVKVDKRYNSWDDDAAPPAKKQCKNGWEEDDDDQRLFVVPDGSKSAIVVKQTPTDQVCRLLKTLMLRYKAYNMAEMYIATSRITDEAEIPFKRLWERLSVRHSISKHMESVLQRLKCENYNKTFQTLVEEFCTTPDTLDPDKYECVTDSYKYFITWCKKQHIDVIEFVTNIIDVVNKTHEKFNTVCLIGDSNSGKNCMFSNPLKPIMKYVGDISNRGNESQFLWQDCINCSMICIDECVMSAQHYEDLKKILGGEPCKIAVKHQGHSTLCRTPCMLTGNRDPWLLNYADKAAFLNRMYYYPVSVDEDLKDIKKIHPGMWWYLQQQYGRTRLLPPSKLKPYPKVTSAVPEEIATDIEDPLL